MKKRDFLGGLAAALASLSMRKVAAADEPARSVLDWSLTMSVLETCSCPVFCQCFFTGKPPAAKASASGHHHQGGEVHYCRFNQAYLVRRGWSGGTSLDGVKFWFLGDAGDDFDKEKLEWALLTFDPSTTLAQRTAMLEALRHLRWYRPERWKSYAIGPDSPVQWESDEKGAHATLGGGRLAELSLTTYTDLGNRPVTMQNMGYFGFPRNNGFTLMPSTLLAYRGSERAFEFRDQGTNGLLTTVDMNAEDFPRKG